MDVQMVTFNLAMEHDESDLFADAMIARSQWVLDTQIRKAHAESVSNTESQYPEGLHTWWL